MPLYISLETFNLPFTAYIQWNNERFPDYHRTTSQVLPTLSSDKLHYPSVSSS